MKCANNAVFFKSLLALILIYFISFLRFWNSSLKSATRVLSKYYLYVTISVSFNSFQINLKTYAYTYFDPIDIKTNISQNSEYIEIKKIVKYAIINLNKYFNIYFFIWIISSSLD